MVGDRLSNTSAGRRRSISTVVLVFIAVAALFTRALEMPASPWGLLRIVFSVVAIAFVFFAPIQSLARRATAVILCEAILGTISFLAIDLPFLTDHRQQIDRLALAIAERVDRFERTTSR